MKAQVIATALGGRVVRIVEVQEEGVQPPRPIYADQFQMKAMAGAVNAYRSGNVGYHVARSTGG